MGNRPIQLRPVLALLALAALGCSPGEWRSPLEGQPTRPAWEYARAPVRPRDVVTISPAALPEPEPRPGSATALPPSPAGRGSPRQDGGTAPGATALPRSGTAVSAPPAAAGAAERSLPDLSHDLDDVLADLEAIVSESFAVQRALLRLRLEKKAPGPAQDGG